METSKIKILSESFFQKKLAILGLFYHLFLVFTNKHYIFLQHYVHLVSGARIQTHDLLDVSLLQ